MNRLFIAAGGGGDALMAKILSENTDESNNYFMTVVWERKMFDPKPGPRSFDDFIGLEKFADSNYIINENSGLAYEGITFVPKLCREIREKFFLLDLSKGAKGVNKQIKELVNILAIDEVFVVDAGGDILAVGNEASLKSPLADSVILSACNELTVPVNVIVTGLGLDGELPIEQLKDIIDDFESNGDIIFKKGLEVNSINKYMPVFSWFPSEVTGMTCLSAQGFRGRAEIRDKGFNVELNDMSSLIYSIKFESVFARNIIAQKLTCTNDLAEVEKVVVSIAGKSEIEYERKKAERIKKDFTGDHDFNSLENKLLEYSQNAITNGISYLSLRRVGEVLEIPYSQLEEFKNVMKERHPKRFRPPVWIC